MAASTCGAQEIFAPGSAPKGRQSPGPLGTPAPPCPATWCTTGAGLLRRASRQLQKLLRLAARSLLTELVFTFGLSRAPRVEPEARRAEAELPSPGLGRDIAADARRAPSQSPPEASSSSPAPSQLNRTRNAPQDATSKAVRPWPGCNWYSLPPPAKTTRHWHSP